MPELPEVEIMARNLQVWFGGRRLRRVEILDPKFEHERWESLTNREFVGATRRGKYAVVRMTGDQSLVFHYRMTGKTVLDPHSRRKARLRFFADEAVVVSFVDPRRFGTVDIVATPHLDDFFNQKNLGPEPWPMPRKGEWWAERLGRVRSPIKVALMRQDRVAGLGNIASSEVLFRSGIHPVQQANDLTLLEWQRIGESVHAFIEHTLDQESSEEIQYVNQGGEGSFSVYGQAGSPCPQCGLSIERLSLSGRSTFFCPKCQPLS